jgi:hypothetical protein
VQAILPILDCAKDFTVGGSIEFEHPVVPGH